MNSHNQIITCLLGDPVDHSVSDVMFEHFAKMTGLENYKHLKLRVPVSSKDNLKTAINALKIFGIAGANITLPYKETVIEYLDSIDETSKTMGAVNTVVNKNGQLVGCNTDGAGAIRAIETKLKPTEKSDRVMILGAGGAARAIIAGLSDKVGQVTILSRDSKINKALKLKNDFEHLKVSIELKFLSENNIIETLNASNIIINATSVGMYPNSNASIFTKNHIEKLIGSGSNIHDKYFFDAIFNPFITDFLKIAQSYGGKTCPGIYMMIYQGLEAFYLWTGRRVPEKEIDSIYSLLRDKIQADYVK